MKDCQKCGSWNIIGPKYEKTWSGREQLRYTCCRCGYSTTTPTKDAEQQEIQFAAPQRSSEEKP